MPRLLNDHDHLPDSQSRVLIDSAVAVLITVARSPTHSWHDVARNCEGYATFVSGDALARLIRTLLAMGELETK